MQALSKHDIRRAASNLDFSGTLTVGVETNPVLENVAGNVIGTPEGYVKAACVIAQKCGFAAFACWPFQLPWAMRYLTAEFPKKQMVVNFPYGTMTLEMALDQMKWGLDNGAEEIDSVVPVQYLQTEDYKGVETYIRKLQDAALPYRVEVKSIIRVGDLMCTADEIQSLSKVKAAAQAVVDGGGAYVKTCTGWNDGKATIRIVKALKSVVKDSGTKVKASGGITCIEDGLALMEAGADRIAGRWPIVLQLRNESAIPGLEALQEAEKDSCS